MAAVEFHATSGENALSTGKTHLQVVAASNHAVKIKGFGVSLKGVSNTDAPVLLEVFRQTTAGTMTSGSAGTDISKKDSRADETLQTTVQKNATAEPTNGDKVFTQLVHPQSGFYILFPPGQEIIVPGGGRMGWKLSHASLTVNAVVDVDGEE